MYWFQVGGFAQNVPSSEYSKEINLILIRLEVNAKPQSEINLYNFMYHNTVSPPS